VATPDVRKEPTMPQLMSRDRGPIAPAPDAHRDAMHLQRLLDAAGRLDLDDLRGWTALAVDASAVLEQLVIGGRISPALVVAPSDPPVVVARTIAAASRSLARSDAARP
jgi:hypothetical protein